VMPDIVWTGGLSEALKIATLADTHHLSIAPHDCTGPVNLFACLHLCAAMPNAMIMETVRGFCEGYYREVTTPDLPLHAGHAALDGFGPGLGVQLRDEFLARSNLRRRVTDLQ
jgi:galactonate dehydratase